MRAKLRILSAAGLSCGLGLFLAACGDQAGSSSVLGTFSDAVPLQARITSDTSLKPKGDSLQATVRQSGTIIGVHRHAAVPFAPGTAISLDTVIQGKPFTVTANGFQVSGGKRVNRWWASGSDSARTADSLQTILLALTKGPVLDSLPKLDSFKVGVKIPARKAPTLWYTLDSSDPRVSKTAHFDSAGTLVTSGQLWKIALKSDSVPATGQPALWSDTTHWIFRANTPVPSFSQPSGTYSSARHLRLTDSLSGASILWSLDSLTWNVFKDSIVLDSSHKIFAKAAIAGKDTSRVVSASYLLQVPTPGLGLTSATYTSIQAAHLSDTLAGVAFHCSSDSLNWIDCKDSVVIDSSRKLFVYASHSGWLASPVASASYVSRIPAPNLSLPSGTYTSVRAAGLSDSVASVAFHCSSDSLSWADCKDSVVIDASRKLFVYASRAGWNNSPIILANYALSLPAPSLSLASGSYAADTSVSANDSVTGATFQYTTDTTLATSWVALTTLPVTRPTTLYVRATKVGWNTSPVVSASYAFSDTLYSLATLQEDSGKVSHLVGSGYLDTVSDTASSATLHLTATSGSDSIFVGGVLAAKGLVTISVPRDTTLAIRVVNPRNLKSTADSIRIVHQLPYLRGLTFNHGKLSPAFSKDLLDYTLLVSSNVSDLTLTATSPETITLNRSTTAINGVPTSLALSSSSRIIVSNSTTGKSTVYALAVVATDWRTDIAYDSISWNGKTYRTLQIAKVGTWMAENLNDSTISTSECYELSAKKCDTAGRLYTWSEAMNGSAATSAGKVQGICPTGWHIPTRSEAETMSYTALNINAFKSFLLWSPQGSDSLGLRILPVGGTTGSAPEAFDGWGNAGYFWTASEDATTLNPYALFIGTESGSTVFQAESFLSTRRFSVRCLKD